eukprot:sb/3474922/
MLTVAMDGKVLRWDVTLSRYKPPQLTLAQAFLVTGSAIPRSHPAAPSNRKSDIGGTSLSCSQEDPTMFVVGTESGLVLKCSTLSNELPMDKGVFMKEPFVGFMKEQFISQLLAHTLPTPNHGEGGFLWDWGA